MDRHSKVECRQQEQMEDHSRRKNHREVSEIREDREQKIMQGESHREVRRLHSSKHPILVNRLKTDRMQETDLLTRPFCARLCMDSSAKSRCVWA